MSGHADTIRAEDIAAARGDALYLRSVYDEAKWWPIADRLQSLADYVDALVAENQQLRDALAEIAMHGIGTSSAWWDGKRCGEVAGAALAGTPSEDA